MAAPAMPALLSLVWPFPGRWLARGIPAVLGLLAQAAPPGVLRLAGFAGQETSAGATVEGQDLVLARGPGEPVVRFPREEQLVYRAYLDLAILEAPVGTVTQTCRIESLRPSILQRDPGPAGEAAVVRLKAEGHYALYTLKSVIESRVLPQDWPHVVYSQASEGTERRRREILLGRRDGAPRASYRRDTDHGAPPGTRIWREATERAVPEGTLDMLGAVLMARTLVREGRDEIAFPLIDKTRVWQLRISRGKERRMETAAGDFDVVEVVLNPGPYPGEVFEDEKLRQFEGVFGIHGTIHLWVERKTGVAVRIQGDLPVGRITLGIDVILQSYSGTPDGFAPLGSQASGSER